MDNIKKRSDNLNIIDKYIDQEETVIRRARSHRRLFQMSPISFVSYTALSIGMATLVVQMSRAQVNYGMRADYSTYLLLIFACAWLGISSWLSCIPGFPKRKIIYFLTDRRAGYVVSTKAKKDKVRSYPLSALNQLEATVYPDGSGNIVFKSEADARADLYSPLLSTLWPRISSGFFDVEDVETATQHLSKLTGIEPTVRKDLFLGVF